MANNRSQARQTTQFQATPEKAHSASDKNVVQRAIEAESFENWKVSGKWAGDLGINLLRTQKTLWTPKAKWTLPVIMAI